MKKISIKQIPFKYKVIFSVFLLSVLLVTALICTKRIINRKNQTNTFYMVKKETYENCIEIAGTVSAAQEQTLQALSDGTVLQVNVKAGDKVKKGDVLIQLDDTTEQYNLAKHDYDMQVTKANGAKREYELMETQRLSLIQKLADRKIEATFDGVIADLDVSINDSLEAKDTVGTIVNVDYLTADVEVAETDVSKLKIGQKVTFTFPAYGDDTVEGYVVSWPAIGTVTSRGATVVNVKVRIDEYPEQILPYFSFTGKIEIEAPVDNLVVERYAVAYEDGKPYVVIAKSNKKVYVKAVPYGGEYVKILEGLSGGEVLQAQSTPKSSGWKKDMRGQMPGMGGGSGGMGAGGPPPAFR